MYINSDLANMFNLPTQIIVLFCSFLYLTKNKISGKEFFVCTAFIFIPALILYNFVYWVGSIYLILAFTFYFIRHTNNKSTIFYLGVLIIIAIIIDHLATLIISSISISNNLNKIIYRILVFVVIYLFVVYIMRLIKDKFIEKISVSSKIKWLMNITVLLSLVFFYFNIFRAFRNTGIEIIKINMYIFIIYLFLTVILLLIIVYIFMKEEKLNALKKEYENFNIYVSSLEQVNKEMAKFRHDYLNILLGLRGYIEENDWKGLKKYFEKGILNFEKKAIVNNAVINNIQNLYIRGLKGLIITKSNKAIEENINISIEIPYPIYNISADIIDLNRILGIFLDNAIENSIEDKVNEINFAIIHKDSDLTQILIRNQIRNKKIAISNIYKEGYTTKSDGRGIGLAVVKQIVDKNPRMLLNTWVDQDWFCVELIIIEG